MRKKKVAVSEMEPFGVADLSRLLKAHKTLVQRWLRRGLFPHARLVKDRRVKSGKRWEIPPSDVLAFKRPPVGRPRLDRRKGV